MKKKYVEPCIEVEKYELDKSIASNCEKVVTFGPGIEGKYDMCDEYDFMGCGFEFNNEDPFVLDARLGYTNGGYSWYEEGCTMEECYYSPLSPMAS